MLGVGCYEFDVRRGPLGQASAPARSLVSSSDCLIVSSSLPLNSHHVESTCPSFPSPATLPLPMSKVRLGIVGLGNIGKFHTGYLLEGKISRCELAAVSDAYTPSLEAFKAKGIPTFDKC